MGDGSVLMGIIAAFATYAVGFLARPAPGGLVFGHFGDKYGRKKLLQISLIMVGFATFLMGCIPSYAVVGFLGTGHARDFTFYSGLCSRW